MRRPAASRGGAVLLAVAVAAMLSGLWGALRLLHLDVPAARTAADDHGMLMALGFLGTLVAVERAVALGRVWGWAAPAASAAAVAALLAVPSSTAGRVLLAFAGLGLVAVYAALHRVQPSLHNGLMALAAAGWVVAAALWAAGWDVARLVPWLAVFLVGTIAAERLELSRVVGAGLAARRQLAATIVLLAAGAAASVWSASLGVRTCGAALVLLAGWLVARDAARRTIRRGGVTRYIAAGLLAGYGWLATAGLLWLVGGPADDSPLFDAQLHALFLGFVLSMVFAHAPVIAPAVLRRPMPYHPRFYGPLALLHGSLLLRVVGGDAAGAHLAWQVGGVLNEVALLLFVCSTAHALTRRGAAGRRTRDAAGRPHAVTAVPAGARAPLRSVGLTAR